MITQFDLVQHYSVMTELDADVHTDEALAQADIDLALRLIGHTPESVFLPCFGTGRHIGPLLDAGVRRIVGVDLSPTCVAKAIDQFGTDQRVQLEVGDLRNWHTRESFQAVIVLGNSFGDIIDPVLLSEVTAGMTAPLCTNGYVVMDYIGTGYLDRCEQSISSEWQAILYGEDVIDRRSPCFNAESRIMTINIEVTNPSTGIRIWKGYYQKLVLTDEEFQRHFRQYGSVVMKSSGISADLNEYYAGYEGELGMLARSQWWVGRKYLTSCG